MARPESNPKPRIGVDTGGTFTDFVCLANGRLVVDKRRSTPNDPSRAILEGVEELRKEPSVNAGGNAIARETERKRMFSAGAQKTTRAGGTVAARVFPKTETQSEVVHGSTVATNAVLERKGARVALVATEGFQDVLQIGRQTRPELYNIFVLPRRPIVDPSLVFGVPERLDYSGKVLISVDLQAVDRIAKTLIRKGVEMVAVCLLHSYANPAHELKVAARLRKAGLRVCSSQEVLPEYREFERWSTTAINAYVTPLIDRYLGKLEEKIEGFQGSRGLSPHPLSTGGARLQIMQSDGGSISAGAARAQAVRTVLSGPAAGVVGAQAVARAAGFHKIISFDMGGTSTDVSLIDDRIAMSTDAVIGDFPVRLPMIDIHTVGAGGGSIAAIDSGGALRVGPQSAGANPGPACYGTGNELTVTDANLLLGRLDPECFFGGKMKLDTARAGELAATLAAKFHLGVPELAEGIIHVANANMERAIRVVSVERGHDPRDFALLAFGGAGGMHACEIAARLEMGTVIVPRHAGVLSALGMLLADVTRDYSASVLRRTDQITLTGLKKCFGPLAELARTELAAEGFSRKRQIIERFVDVRYVGQSYEISLEFSPDYRGEFDRRHGKLYGYSNPGRPTEIVNVRVRASGVTEKPELPWSRPRAAMARPMAIRSSWFGGRRLRTGFYQWSELRPGARGRGPAVVTGGEASVVIPPGFEFRVDGFGNIVAEGI